MPRDARELRDQAAREFALMSVLVYVVAGVILAVPGFFLATGVQAIGAGLAWWAGDPDAKGGEELVGITVGLVSALIVLVVAAMTTRELGRRYGFPVRVPVAVGTAAILLGLASLCVGVVAA